MLAAPRGRAGAGSPARGDVAVPVGPCDLAQGFLLLHKAWGWESSAGQESQGSGPFWVVAPQCILIGCLFSVTTWQNTGNITKLGQIWGMAFVDRTGWGLPTPPLSAHREISSLWSINSPLGTESTLTLSAPPLFQENPGLKPTPGLRHGSCVVIGGGVGDI